RRRRHEHAKPVSTQTHRISIRISKTAQRRARKCGAPESKTIACPAKQTYFAEPCSHFQFVGTGGLTYRAPISFGGNFLDHRLETKHELNCLLQALTVP